MGMIEQTNPRAVGIVTEYFERGSLDDFLYPETQPDEPPRVSPAITVPQIKSIVLDVVEALVYLHGFVQQKKKRLIVQPCRLTYPKGANRRLRIET